jgi:signal transduction histidine kinase
VSKPIPLGAWLALLSLGLVLLVVAGLVPAALGLFEQLAEENARARVRLAAIGAVEAAEREAREVATAAQILAERPTLHRLVSTGATAEAVDFLERFCDTSGLDGCAVLRDGEIVAAAPEGLPWRALGDGARSVPRDPTPAAPRFLLLATSAPATAAAAPLEGGAGGEVVVVRRLGTEAEHRLSDQVGLAVRITAEDGSAQPPEGSYRARAPLGEVSGIWVEAALPDAEVAAVLRPLRRSFTVVTIAAATLAVVLGALAGRRLARPLAELRRSAQRIGSGDLARPVPPAAGAEASALASTMEEMRRRLLALTADLRRSEAEAQALLAGTAEGVFAVDGERRVRYLNPHAADLLGVEPQDALGRFCGDVLRPRLVDGSRPCETSCPIVHARSRGSSRAVEHLELAGGTRRTVVVTSAPPAGGRQVQVMRDETEEEGARRARDAILANVSHELKTPLAAQLASIELLLDGVDRLGADAIRPLVQSLERSTLRLTRLIDNLLESVRIETGRVPWSPVTVDLAEVVSEAAASARPLLEQRNQRLEIDLPPELPAVEGNPTQLSQVLINLLANAHKYAPEGSAIRVGARAEAGSAEATLWVEDAGPGVPPAASESIFDRFHRGARSQKGQDGMGLGLWIVKSIAVRHGGRVAVGPGDLGGARFMVTLPAAIPKEAAEESIG